MGKNTNVNLNMGSLNSVVVLPDNPSATSTFDQTISHGQRIYLLVLGNSLGHQKLLQFLLPFAKQWVFIIHAENTDWIKAKLTTLGQSDLFGGFSEHTLGISISKHQVICDAIDKSYNKAVVELAILNASTND